MKVMQRTFGQAKQISEIAHQFVGGISAPKSNSDKAKVYNASSHGFVDLHAIYREALLEGMKTLLYFPVVPTSSESKCPEVDEWVMSDEEADVWEAQILAEYNAGETFPLR